MDLICQHLLKDEDIPPLQEIKTDLYHVHRDYMSSVFSGIMNDKYEFAKLFYRHHHQFLYNDPDNFYLKYIIRKPNNLQEYKEFICEYDNMFVYNTKLIEVVIDKINNNNIIYHFYENEIDIFIDSIEINNIIKYLNKYKIMYTIYHKNIDSKNTKIKNYILFKNINIIDYKALTILFTYMLPSNVIFNFLRDESLSLYLYKEYEYYKSVNTYCFKNIYDVIDKYPKLVFNDALYRNIKYIYKNFAKFMLYPELFQDLYNIGNEYLKNTSNDPFLNTEINYHLAKIMLSSASALSKDEYYMVLQYLFNSADFEDAPRLRKLIFMEKIMDLKFGTELNFEIALNFDTLINLVSFYKNNK